MEERENVFITWFPSAIWISIVSFAIEFLLLYALGFLHMDIASLVYLVVVVGTPLLIPFCVHVVIIGTTCSYLRRKLNVRHEFLMYGALSLILTVLVTVLITGFDTYTRSMSQSDIERDFVRYMVSNFGFYFAFVAISTPYSFFIWRKKFARVNVT